MDYSEITRNHRHQIHVFSVTLSSLLRISGIYILLWMKDGWVGCVYECVRVRMIDDNEKKVMAQKEIERKEKIENNYFT